MERTGIEAPPYRRRAGALRTTDLGTYATRIKAATLAKARKPMVLADVDPGVSSSSPRRALRRPSRKHRGYSYTTAVR